MKNPESKRPVTIEDLLRVKRAERPPAEFWTEFEREMRVKQLAALVEKRPWWRSLPQFSFRGLARFHLPLGAAAVLAVTLFSIRGYHPALTQPVSDAAVAGEAQGAAIAADLAANAGTAPGDAAGFSGGVAVSESVQPAGETVALSSEANAPGELARMVPLLTASADAQREIRPSERSIAENRIVAEAMLGMTSGGFETRALPARTTPQEPLAQMSNPSETRRHRYAAAFASAAIGTSPVPTARVARRLSDEQLYDSIHRFGASGSSVSFKF